MVKAIGRKAETFRPGGNYSPKLVRMPETTIQQSPLKLTWVYGILIAMVCIALTMIFYMTSRAANLWTGYLVNGILFLGVLFSVIHANKALGGRASLGNLLTMGILTATIAIIMIATTTIIFHLATEPPAGTTVNIPSDGGQISDFSSTKREGFWIFLLGNIFFVNLVLGFLAAGIGAMTVKRNQKTTAAK